MRALVRILGLLILAGCHGTNMPTPVVYTDTDADPFAQIDTRNATRVPLFFATDRNPRPEESPAERYGGRRGDVLRLGRATLLLGKDGHDLSDLRKRMRRGLPLAHRIESVEEFGRLWSTISPTDPAGLAKARASMDENDEIRKPSREFAAAVNRKLADSNYRDIVVFVSGYNATFSMSVRLAGQLHNFMSRAGAMIAFGWPSVGNAFTYLRDHQSGDLSARNLRQLLLFLAAETKVHRIHLLSFSTGASIVSDALLQLRLLHAQTPLDKMRKRLRIGHVIFAAPDEDLMYFRNLILDCVHDLPERITVYTSGNDISLALASLAVYGYTRAGRSASALTDTDRAVLRGQAESGFVDVTTAQYHAGSGDLGHRYWFQNPWVLSDIILAFQHDLAPGERSLVRDEGEALWSFPRDYPQRARAITERYSRAR